MMGTFAFGSFLFVMFESKFLILPRYNCRDTMSDDGHFISYHFVISFIVFPTRTRSSSTDRFVRWGVSFACRPDAGCSARTPVPDPGDTTAEPSWIRCVLVGTNRAGRRFRPTGLPEDPTQTRSGSAAGAACPTFPRAVFCGAGP